MKFIVQNSPEAEEEVGYIYLREGCGGDIATMMIKVNDKSYPLVGIQQRGEGELLATRWATGWPKGLVSKDWHGRIRDLYEDN